MDIKELQQLIIDHQSDIAFVIGQGVHNYPYLTKNLSWNELLKQLWQELNFQNADRLRKVTNMYDFIHNPDLINDKKTNINKEIARLMKKREPKLVHQYIVSRIKKLNAPILTTIFDETLSKTFNYKRFILDQKSFNAYYPWTVYHAESPLSDPLQGFGIWYINGMIHYPSSLIYSKQQCYKLTNRFLSLIDSLDQEDCFNKPNNIVLNSWINILFNKSLFVFGMGNEIQDDFLSFVLFARASYYRCFPEKKHKSWYVCHALSPIAEEYTVHSLKKKDFEIIELNSTKDIYENIWLDLKV